MMIWVIKVETAHFLKCAPEFTGLDLENDVEEKIKNCGRCIRQKLRLSLVQNKST